MKAKLKRNLDRPKERGIRALPDGRYLVRWKIRGRLHQQLCDTITRARELRNRVKATAGEGKHVREPSYGRVSFTQTAMRFLEHSRCNLRPATVREDERYTAGWLDNPLFGDRLLQEIELGDIELYKQQLGNRRSQTNDALPDRRLSRRAVDIEIGRLKRLFKLAVVWGLIDKSPATHVKLHREENARNRFLSQEEEESLLAVSSERLQAIIRFAIQTGLRKGEMIGLRWRDVDMSRAQLTIHAARAKSKRSRYIPLNDSAMGILRTLGSVGEPDSPVFPNRAGKPMENLHHQFRTAVLAAGLKDVSFHTLRHTFASRIVMATGSLVNARELLGHRDFQVTLRYAHLTDEHLRAAVKKIG